MLPDAVRDDMEEEISCNEIERAIKALASRKSPGVDGLGTAFYQRFSSQLAPVLCDVYRDIRNRNLLPPSMRQATVVLIPKKGNTAAVATAEGFRPISLLTTDYKILAKILAKRLDHALEIVVRPHQTYGFKGRTITTNAHIMRIIIETAVALHKPTAVVQIDLSKAFDKVAHSFLFSMLKACGVGKLMSDYIRLCYRGITARILINGCLSRAIPVESSVRQGCPLSPVLFALYLEPLCRTIINDCNINGALLSTEPTKILAYADDVSVICSSKSDILRAFQHINAFCSVSGAEINVAKSTGAWLGPWPNMPETFLGISWTTSVNNYLGVKLGEENLRTGLGGIHLDTLRAKVVEWHGRNVPLLNRSFVCNSVFFSSVWYSAQVVPCRQADVHRMHRFCATFVWDSCFERMRRSNLFVSPFKGGLGLVNLDIKLRVQRFLFFREKT